MDHLWIGGILDTRESKWRPNRLRQPTLSSHYFGNYLLRVAETRTKAVTLFTETVVKSQLTITISTDCYGARTIEIQLKYNRNGQFFQQSHV